MGKSTTILKEYQMKKVITGILSFVTLCLILSLAPGCSENPQSALTTTASTTSGNVAENLLGVNGDTVTARAVFSVGWRDLLDPATSTDSVMGAAEAVAFDTTQAKSMRGAHHTEIDIGSVTLNYGSTNLTLNKITGPRGEVMYTSLSGPRMEGSGSNIQFVANGTYEFDVSGSAQFSAFKASLTAPAGLLKITSPSEDQKIDTSADLAITWQGGDPNTAVLFQLVPQRLRVENDSGFLHAPLPDSERIGPHGRLGGPDWGMRGEPPDRGRMDRGGERHGPGGPGGRMIGPPMLDSTRAVIVQLGGNPGTYTITAAQLKELIHNSWANGFRCSINQSVVTEISHDGGTVRLMLQNDDAIQLVLQ